MPDEEQAQRLRNVVNRRRFIIVDRYKQSQPQRLDVFNSPRTSIPPPLHGVQFRIPPRVTLPPSAASSSSRDHIAIRIDDENGEDIGTPPPHTPPPLFPEPSPFLLTPALPAENEDVKSQISFIMKERLHTLAKEVQRRTSTVRENLLKEVEEDQASIISSNVPKDEQHRPSLMSLIGLQKVQEVADAVDARRCIPESINAHGKLYLAWLFVVASAFLYNAFGIPLRSSYPYQTKDNLVYWLIVDYTCDLIYLIDILLFKPRLRFIKGGITVRSPKEMAKNYLHSGTFKLDLVSLAPLDLGYFYSGPYPLWRFCRIFKIKSFWALFDMLDNSVSNPYAIRIARTLSYMIYIIHCNSCIYYMLSAWQAFGQIAYKENGKYYLNKWVYNNQGNAYIRCFYFTAAVATSTGNNPAPTNVIEYIYMTFSWMMGVFVFALLLGQIRDIVSNASRNREDYRRQMDMALSECKRLNLSKELTDRDCDRALLRDLVLKLRPVIFLPGDMICQKGDVGKEMYIVNQGVLQVVGGEKNEIVFAELKEGNVFGEISLLAIGGNNRRTASIRAKGYATLFSLTKEDLNDVIKYYPQAQALLKKKAAQMLKNDKKTETDKEAPKDIKETCKITAGGGTPKMLKLVAEMLPPEKKTTQELMDAIDRGHQRRPSMYPWMEEKEDSDSAFEGEGIGEFSDADIDEEPEEEEVDEKVKKDQ